MIVELTLINIALIIFPLMTMLIKEVKEIKERKSFFYFLLVYLCGIIFFYGFQAVGGIYLRWISDPFIIMLGLLFFIATILIIVRMFQEHIDKRMYFLTILLFIFTLFLFISSIFYVPSDLGKLNPTSVVSIFIILIISVGISFGTLYLFYRFVKKREIKWEIPQKDLKYVIYFFTIALILFFSISLIHFFINPKAQFLFSGFVEFGDVGDKIWAVMGTIMFDPFFMIVAVFTMLGATVRTLGTSIVRLFGNLVMTFLPMLLWLTYFFGDTPDAIIDLFMGWEWFAKVFHIILTTMLLVTILSAWNVFSTIVMVD